MMEKVAIKVVRGEAQFTNPRFMEREPILYNEADDTVYVGPPGSYHRDLAIQFGLGEGGIDVRKRAGIAAGSLMRDNYNIQWARMPMKNGQPLSNAEVWNAVYPDNPWPYEENWSFGKVANEDVWEDEGGSQVPEPFNPNALEIREVVSDSGGDSWSESRRPIIIDLDTNIAWVGNAGMHYYLRQAVQNTLHQNISTDNCLYAVYAGGRVTYPYRTLDLTDNDLAAIKTYIESWFSPQEEKKDDWTLEAAVVEWQPVSNTHVAIRSSGGTPEDRTLAEEKLLNQLKEYGYKRALMDFPAMESEDRYLIVRGQTPGSNLDLTNQPWALVNSRIYLGQPGTTHRDLATEFGFKGNSLYSSVLGELSPEKSVTFTLNGSGLPSREVRKIKDSLGDRWRTSKEAAWVDVQDKARRLVQQGKVNILRNGYNNIVAFVQGDHGDYDVEIVRQDPKSRVVSSWSCSCPWGGFSWGRTRQWKKFEGRQCSHVLATLWLAQATPLDEDAGGQPMYPGQRKPPPPKGPPTPQEPTQLGLAPEEFGRTPELPNQNIAPSEQMVRRPEVKREIEPPTPDRPMPPQRPRMPTPGRGIIPPARQLEMIPPGTIPSGQKAPPGTTTVSVPGARQPNTPFNPHQMPGTFSSVKTATKIQRIDFDVTDLNRFGEDREPILYDEGSDQAFIGPIGAYHADLWDHLENTFASSGENEYGLEGPLRFGSIRWSENGVPEIKFFDEYLKPLATEVMNFLKQPAEEKEEWKLAARNYQVKEVDSPVEGITEWQREDLSGRRPLAVDTNKGIAYVGSDGSTHMELFESEPDLFRIQPLVCGEVWKDKVNVWNASAKEAIPAVSQALGVGTGSYPNDSGYEVDWKLSSEAAFPEGRAVRLNESIMGQMEGKSEEHGSGQWKDIPKNSIGEVVYQDPTTGWVECIFVGPQADAGAMEPYHVKTFVEPEKLTLLDRNPPAR